jgi:hypothetical protein
VASAWGASWGVAWGNSWGAGFAPVVEIDTHDGGKERERIKRKRRDRESLREQLERAFSPPVVAQEMREALVPANLPLGRIERRTKPDNLAQIIEAGTLGALLEQDDEEAIIALLGSL